MDIVCGNLKVLFMHMSYSEITYSAYNENFINNCFHVNKNKFLEKCQLEFLQRSVDEHENCYRLLCEDMKYKSYRPSVFNLVIKLAKKFLVYNSGDVLCDFEQLLRWREISLPLGQDFFICAFLADHDIDNGIERKHFKWLPIIMSDNSRIYSILERGIAENHFHLKGSSRIFEINWIYLMNHIIGQGKKFALITKSLYESGYSIENFGQKFYDMCKLAAFYRVYLFLVLRGNCMDHFDIRWGASIDIYLDEIQGCINLARYEYGGCISNLQKNQFETSEVLDYALRQDMMDENNTEYVSLAGERSFLYECYKACFSGKFNDYQQNMFYSYLKMRIAFRNEMVQTNRCVGFQNFSDYEKRKECFIGDNPAYYDEFLRMAITGQLCRDYLISLEMRVVPQKCAKDIFVVLKKYEDILEVTPYNADRCKYVMHFPKRKSSRGAEWHNIECRNIEIRRESKKRAKALAVFLQSHSRFRNQIVGIDACASEFGCRPEVFGQLFRYMHYVSFEPKNVFLAHISHKLKNDKMTNIKRINLTYHAGEDFWDIVDGLRAIDELMLFCGLNRGSRIGHALALGINPCQYYASKGNVLVLPKQDLLDDIAWLLHNADHYCCEISQDLRLGLQEQFSKLFNSVFESFIKENESIGNMVDISADIYYRSWKLRGDNPDCYNCSFYEFQKFYRNYSKTVITDWDRFAFNFHDSVSDDLRNDPIVYQLNRYYAFDKEVRERGNQMETFKVKPDYADIVMQVQNCMIKVLAEKGIAIETNPSSNYLIGTIDRYDQHPIVRFNNRKLQHTEKNTSLSVSINTDDQGVFDTLLENEYALLVLALKKAKDANGNALYDIEDIYEWLDYVRDLGIMQVFK